jgi:hypothetical protein
MPQHVIRHSTRMMLCVITAVLLLTVVPHKAFCQIISGGGVPNIYSNGTNIGIGTANPSYNLDILGNGVTAPSMRVSGSGINAGSGEPSIILNTTDTGGPTAWSIKAGSSNSIQNLRIGANGAQDLINITTNGGLGLSTTSPQAGLDNNTGSFLIRGGTAPTISSCGTSPSVAGAGSSHKLTIGTGTVTACTVNLGATYSTAPNACTLTPGNATAAAWGTTGAYVSAISTTQYTIAGANLTSAIYYVTCM